MKLHPLPYADLFNQFSLVCLNARGRYVELHPQSRDLDQFRDGTEVKPADVPGYIARRIHLPKGVTDVFVWVHGWQNEHLWALGTARRLFGAIKQVHAARPAAYPNLASFTPWFVAVRWPSLSSHLPAGYRKIRDRAHQLTDQGDAAFFLASLLGYLDQRNQRQGGTGSKTLAAKGGYFIHCLGHSFGGRFLTAAIGACANPTPKTLSLLAGVRPAERKTLAATPAANGFQFTVDSVLVFQMAANCSTFGPQLRALVEKAPLRGPVVLTHSDSDRANCAWHGVAEGGEPGIGCEGAKEPHEHLSDVRLGGLDYTYTAQDFGTKIVNVNASEAFTKRGFRAEGAHGDFWYEESIHLILSLANFVRV